MRSKFSLKWKKYILNIFLIFLIVISSCLLSACTFLNVNRDEPQRVDKKEEELYILPENKEYLNDVETVRSIILAMDNPDKIESIWKHIPTIQRRELSLSHFNKYIKILNQVLPDPVNSFKKVNEELSDNIKLTISRAVPTLSEEVERASFWRIQTIDRERRLQEFIICVNHDEDGVPYFSSHWFERQSFLYDYILLYFDAIESHNHDALYSLLYQPQNSHYHRYSEVIESRIEGLFDFYQEYTIYNWRSYRIRELFPGYAKVDQLNVPRKLGFENNSRSITFRESDRRIIIDESIPEKLDLNDLEVYLTDELSMKLESSTKYLWSSNAIKALGVPLEIKALDAENDDEEEDREQITAGDNIDFRVTWPGLKIDAFGSFDAKNLSFNGIVKRIDLFYSNFSTSSGLTVGDSLEKLYILYPFARENDYIIRGKTDDFSFSLAIQLEANDIVRLTFISEDAPGLR